MFARLVSELGDHRHAAASALCVAVLVACSETPIDALVSEGISIDGRGGAGGLGGTGGSGGEAAPEGGESSMPPPLVECQVRPTIAAGTYSIRAKSTGECLNPGDPIDLKTPLPAQGKQLGITASCPGARWLVTDSQTVETAFLLSIRTSDLNNVVDVETAATEEGTRVVLYRWNDYDNQRFFILERGPSTFEIRPVHADDMCLTVKPLGLEIWLCDPADDTQAFQFYSCPAEE